MGWLDSTMSFAVYDFFKKRRQPSGDCPRVRTNHHRDGRIDHQREAESLPSRRTPGAFGKSPGTWAANLLVSVDYTDRTSDVSAEIAKNLGIATSDLFNVAITCFAASGL